jgi:hypothetical protein
MNLYTLALFVHICGVIGTFIAVGTWLFGMYALRRAQRVEQVRVLCDMLHLADGVMVGSILLLLAAGLYMAVTAWGLSTGWIAVALISFVLVAPVGPLVVEPRLKAIAALVTSPAEGFLNDDLRRRAHDAVMGMSLQTMFIWLLGIEFLMTNKPDVFLSIAVMGAALVVGVASGALFWSPHRSSGTTP